MNLGQGNITLLLLPINIYRILSMFQAFKQTLSYIIFKITIKLDILILFYQFKK